MKFKALLALGIVATIGATLWMRQIASWRPQIVGRLDMRPMDFQLSRDGRFLFVEGLSNTLTRIGKSQMRTMKTVILNLEDASLSQDPRQIRDFDSQYAPPTFPRVHVDQKLHLVFSPARGQNRLLAGNIRLNYYDFPPFLIGASHFAWSKTRGEVYREDNGELSIWDWNTGQLKKRHRARKPSGFRTAIFSPDGQSLLAFDQSPQGVNSLRRYDVPTGRETRVIHRGGRRFSGSRAEAFGWSPDGKAIWFVRQDDMMEYLDFNVVRAADSKKMWSAPCAGPSQWLPDGRIGLIQKDGFSFRDASGREIGRASGPLGSATGWQASSDRKWIYSMERTSGLIRRWRAK